MEEQKTLQQRFQEFHSNNPHVWKLFIRFAVQMVRAGHQTLSASLVVERIRWETNIVTRSDDRFKIANAHRAYYARLWNDKFPSLPPFRTKELTSV